MTTPETQQIDPTEIVSTEQKLTLKEELCPHGPLKAIVCALTCNDCDSQKK